MRENRMKGESESDSEEESEEEKEKPTPKPAKTKADSVSEVTKQVEKVSVNSSGGMRTTGGMSTQYDTVAGGNTQQEEEEEESEEEEAGESAAVLAMRARLDQIRREKADGGVQKPAAAVAKPVAKPVAKEKAPVKPAAKKDKDAIIPTPLSSVFNVTADGAAPAPASERDQQLEGLTRKQREVVEAQRGKEAYMKRHLAGETVEAKKQLAQLAEVRRRRAEAEAARVASAASAPVAQNRLQYDSDSSDSDSDSADSEDEDSSSEEEDLMKKPTDKGKSKEKGKKLSKEEEAAAKAKKAIEKLPKLTSIEIKKMSGDLLKDHLRNRQLGLQGQKKELMQRLIDFETKR